MSLLGACIFPTSLAFLFWAFLSRALFVKWSPGNKRLPVFLCEVDFSTCPSWCASLESLFSSHSYSCGMLSKFLWGLDVKKTSPFLLAGFLSCHVTTPCCTSPPHNAICHPVTWPEGPHKTQELWVKSAYCYKAPGLGCFHHSKRKETQTRQVFFLSILSKQFRIMTLYTTFAMC